eukprot:6200903-Pleurochrysis_carterae.AAC.1
MKFSFAPGKTSAQKNPVSPVSSNLVNLHTTHPVARAQKEQLDEWVGAAVLLQEHGALYPGVRLIRHARSCFRCLRTAHVRGMLECNCSSAPTAGGQYRQRQRRRGIRAG